MGCKMDEGSSMETYYPDGGYGWVIVGAIILINVSLQTLIPCFGLIFRDEFKTWGVTSAQTSFLLHLNNSLYCLLGFLTSPFLKKYGIRAVAYIGATFMCLGLFLTSFATSYTYLIVSVSVLMGVGQGIIMPSTYFATYTYFKKKLTIATSLTVTSASLSSILMPKVCDTLLRHIGRQYTILFLFCLSLLSFVGCTLLKPVKKKNGKEEEPNPLEIIQNGTKHQENGEVIEELLRENSSVNQSISDESNEPTQNSNTWTRFFDIFDLHLVKDIPFVLVAIGLGVSFAAELNIILMLQFILRDLCLFERSDVATAASIQSVADIFGRLLIPLMGHYVDVPEKYMYAAALIVASFGRTVLAIWPTEYLVVFAVIVLIGLTKGTRAVFQSVILPKYVSLNKLPAANGLNMLFTGSVSLIIGPLIGLIHDQSGSYVNTLIAASVLSLCCVAMWIFEFIFLRQQLEPNNSKK